MYVIGLEWPNNDTWKQGVYALLSILPITLVIVRAIGKRLGHSEEPMYFGASFRCTLRNQISVGGSKLPL